MTHQWHHAHLMMTSSEWSPVRVHLGVGPSTLCFFLPLKWKCTMRSFSPKCFCEISEIFQNFFKFLPNHLQNYRASNQLQNYRYVSNSKNWNFVRYLLGNQKSLWGQHKIEFRPQKTIRPKQIMTLFPVGRPGHFFPNSETFFGPECIQRWQCHVCKCTQRVIPQSNLNRIPQSKHLQGSRDSQLSTRKPPNCLLDFSGCTKTGIHHMLYKNSESVNFDIDPCHDICTMYIVHV